MITKEFFMPLVDAYTSWSNKVNIFGEFIGFIGNPIFAKIFFIVYMLVGISGLLVGISGFILLILHIYAFLDIKFLDYKHNKRIKKYKKRIKTIYKI